MVSPADALFGAGILASLVLCWFSYYSYRRWDEPGVGSFAAFVGIMGGIGVIGGASSLVFGAQYGGVTTWAGPALVGVFLWAIAWGLFGLQYTGRYTRIGWRTIGILLAPYLITLLSAAVQFGTPRDVSTLEVVLSVLVGLYFFGMVALGIVLVLKTTTEYSHLSLGGGIILVLAPLSNLAVVNGANEVSEPMVNAIMYFSAYSIPAVALAISLFYYETFDATPAVGTIGEREMIHTIDDLVFVVDDRDHIIKCNDSVAETLGVPGPEVLGETLCSVLGADIETLQREETISLEAEFGTRRYDSRVRNLTDQHDRDLGLLVSLHDVTDHELREQRLTVLNRVLRHNLRNKVDGVKGRAEVLQADGDSEHATKIIDLAEEITELGQSARAIDQFVSESPQSSSVDIVTEIEQILSTSQQNNSAVTVAVDAPETAPVVTTAPALASALESAIDNAISYSDSSVEIAVRPRSDGYEISVVDDGPGIPQGELEHLDTGTETPLQHGTGLGLWQLTWAVRTMGGELEFDTSDGTTVTFTVPEQ